MVERQVQRPSVLRARRASSEDGRGRSSSSSRDRRRRRRPDSSPSPSTVATALHTPTGWQPRSTVENTWTGQLSAMDDQLLCLPRLAAALSAVGVATTVTSAASRSAFSAAANQRGALQDRMHDWVGYCDQAGQSTVLGSCPPFLSRAADMLPDKLVLLGLLLTLLLFVSAARRSHGVRALAKLLSESLGLWALLLVLRATTVSATIMPAPAPLCRNATTWAIGPGGRPAKGWFLTPIDCNDAMFSGHTTTYSVMLVFWMHSHVPRWVKFLWAGFYLLCCFASFATRCGANITHAAGFFPHAHWCCTATANLSVLFRMRQGPLHVGCSRGDVYFRPGLHAQSHSDS